MSQNSTIIPDSNGVTFLTNLNNATDTLKTNQSGLTAPTTPAAGWSWLDTTLNLFKIRNTANSAWLTMVDDTNAQTIAGVKTFSSSPINPTPAVGDNTTKSATTAFVIAEIPNQIHSATSKVTPVDADEIPISDSAATFGIKKLTWANTKATLKTYFDTLYAAAGTASPSGIRQTVQTGLVDVNGYAVFGTIGTGLSVNIAATAVPLKIHASGGAISADRVGTISADTSLGGLTANVINYIYGDVATNGTVTLGFTTLAPIYQFGGTPSVTNGQFTYNIGEGKAYRGNGATAPQVYTTFLLEALAGATTITSVTNYALNGLYISAQNTYPSTNTELSMNSNIGSPIIDIVQELICTTAEAGYSIGDIAYTMTGATSATNIYMKGTKGNAIGIYSGSMPTIVNRTSGGNFTITQANWKVRVTVMRRF